MVAKSVSIRMINSGNQPEAWRGRGILSEIWGGGEVTIWLKVHSGEMKLVLGWNINFSDNPYSG